MKRMNRARLRACVIVVLSENPAVTFGGWPLLVWQNVPEPSVAHPHLQSGAAAALTERLVSGVLGNTAVLDCVLDAHLPNECAIDPVERSLLRVGAWELLDGETPSPVVLKAMTWLPLRFGRHDSADFIDGILAKIAQTKSVAL